MSAIKKLSLHDVFFASKPRMPQPFRLAPRRDERARPMLAKQFAEGVVHYSSFRAAYLEPTPKIGVRRVPSAHGTMVTEHFHIPQPWRRVTPKAVRPGHARRRAA